jgi:thymidylate kinase
MTNGIYLQLDGIDGAGKSTLLETARAWCTERGLTVFDTVAFAKQEGRIPTPKEVGDAAVLLTAEPTHAWIGRAIRDEIIATGTPYGARFAAQAFALDRAVQITRLIRPFVDSAPGRIVIQDRGLISSLAYQPLQSEIEKDAEPVTTEWLLSLDGNRMALETPPTAFIFLDVDPAVAQTRLAGRSDKIDNVRFDDPAFQTALAARYRQSDVTVPLTDRGTKIFSIDGGKTKPEVAVAMREILERLSPRS